MTDPEIARAVRRLRDHDYEDCKAAVEALAARIENLDLLLAIDAPCPELRAALKPLKGTFFEPTLPAYHSAWRAIDSATVRWKDLPVPSAAPTHGDDLPRPAEEPDGST